MALTDHCDIFGSFHEDGFNRIVKHIMLQRPSLFNYGTADLVGKERYYCKPIEAHPSVKQFGNPLITVSPYLPIPGYNGPYGMSYIMQITDALIDFHPSNVIEIPSELNPPLKDQKFALKFSFCVGMGCPDEGLLEEISSIDEQYDGKDKDRPREPQGPKQGLPFKKMTCFCLDVYAVLHVERQNDQIKMKLDGIEIVDVRPLGLENILECYIESIVKLSLLPKLKIQLSDLIFDIESYVTIQPTPISGDVPFNPSIAKDELSVFVNLN